MSKHSLVEEELFDDELLADMQPPPKKRQRMGQNDKGNSNNNSGTWSCTTCTFANKHTNLQCEICDTIKPSTNDDDIVTTVSLNNNSNINDKDDDDNDQKKEDATATNVCPKCGEEAIIIERKMSDAANNSSNDKFDCKDVNWNDHDISIYLECFKCSITFCGECQNIPFHFDYKTCKDYKDYEKALKIQFQTDNDGDDDINPMLCVDTIMDNCFLISNIFTIEQQIQLYDQIVNSSQIKQIGMVVNSGNVSNALFRQTFRPLFMQHHYADTSSFGGFFRQQNGQKFSGQVNLHYRFAKYVDHVVKIVKKLKETDENFCVGFPTKYKCTYISAIEYSAPKGTIVKHCDHMKGWVLLFSLGCKPDFYVQHIPNHNLNGHFWAGRGIKADNKGTQKIKCGEELIDFNSGSVLIFDSSQEAAVYHEIKSIQSHTCPKLLGDKRSSLKTTRVSLQFRIVQG